MSDETKPATADMWQWVPYEDAETGEWLWRRRMAATPGAIVSAA